ncbi:MAG: hypothetical protein ACREV6_18125 [Clostridium sp.]|uniref:hypothetical protein n=1 Tax=Clostridium sp. TaxID=1506 RepID=UPI003D6D9EDC
MDCQISKNLIDLLLDEEIDAIAKEDVLGHIKKCDHCKEYYNNINKFKNTMSVFSYKYNLKNSNINESVMKNIMNKDKSKNKFIIGFCDKKKYLAISLLIIMFIPFSFKAFGAGLELINEIIFNSNGVKYKFNSYEEPLPFDLSDKELVSPVTKKTAYNIKEAKKISNRIVLSNYLPKNYRFMYANYQEISNSIYDFTLNYRQIDYLKKGKRIEHFTGNTIIIDIVHSAVKQKELQATFKKGTSLKKIKISKFDAVIGEFKIDEDSTDKNIFIHIPDKDMYIDLFAFCTVDILDDKELVKILESIVEQL